jgi:7-carboxy-7-deazaguanine synthase
MDQNGIKLIEVFNSWQGEGPDCGRSMLILRFKSCNRNCAWCDTKVKMRITPEAEYTISQIQEILTETGAGILVTGGEPTVKRHFADCVKLLTLLSYPVANVESNGHDLKNLMDRTYHKNINYIFSPKIFNSNDVEEAKDITIDLFSNYTSNINIKAVYEPENGHLIEYLDWVHELRLYQKHSTGKYYNVPGQRVYLMPEGVTRSALIQNSAKVFDAAEKYGFNFSSRDHIIYGFI